MRKMQRLLLLLGTAALTLATTACSNDKDDNGGNGGGITPTEGVTTEAFYKGDLYGAGTGNLWINFISDMEYDASAGDYTGPGYILCLDFNTTLAANADFAALAEGTYTCDYTNDTHEAFSLNVAHGDSYLARYNANGGAESFDITGGTVTVSTQEGYYRIDAALTLSDGSEYAYSFIGAISFLNRSDEGQMSNLTQDTEVKGLSQALLAYGGTVFTETSDLYTVLLAGPDYDLDSNYGQSDALMLSVNVTPGSSTGIPSGTYTVIDAMTADDYDVNTLLSGVYEPAYGGYFGAWYFSTTGKVEASLRSGTVTVTNRGGNEYTFEIDLKDGYGHRITGSYAGVCRVEDWS